MQLDLSHDFADCVDNFLPGGVTLTHVRGDGNTVLPLAIAKQRPIGNKQLAASNGVYTGLDTRFLFPASQLTTFQPRPRDTIVKALAPSVTYTILEANGRKHDQAGRPQTWECVCRNPVIFYGLEDTIAIEQSAQDFGSQPATLRLWPSSEPRGGQVLYRDLPCRVQPQRAETTDERGLEGQQTMYLIYVAWQLVLPNVRECRVVWTPRGQTTPKILARLAYHNAERIDELPVLEATAEV